MEITKHWAYRLKKEDVVLANIRHESDGSLNRNNVAVIVISVKDNFIECSEKTTGEIHAISFCELSKYDYNQFFNTIEIKIDRATLPKDKQKIAFQDNDEHWHEGEFSSGDDLFVTTDNKAYIVGDIVCWCDILDIKYVAIKK